MNVAESAYYFTQANERLTGTPNLVRPVVTVLVTVASEVIGVAKYVVIAPQLARTTGY